MTINQLDTLPTFPSRQNSQVAYDAQVAIWGPAVGLMVTQFNSNVDALNDVAETAAEAITASDAAIAAAHYKGAWAELTGPLAIPASVSHSGAIWLLLEDLADVTANTPSDASSVWLRVVITEATSDQIRAYADNPFNITTRRLRAASAPISPSGASNWTPDWESFASANWSITANRIINNPINVIPGTTRVLKIRSSSSSPRTISWGDNFEGAIPETPVTNTQFLFLTMTAMSSTEIVVAHLEY